MRQVLRYTATLYGLQLVSGGLAYLLMDLRWLSISLALAFVVLVWFVGRSLPGDLDGDRYPASVRRRWVHGAVALLMGAVWQVPGLLAPIRFLRERLGWASYDGISDLYDFLCETWHLNLMPVLAAIPPGTVDGYHARYYIGLLLSSPAVIALLVLAALWRPRAGKKPRQGA